MKSTLPRVIAAMGLCVTTVVSAIADTYPRQPGVDIIDYSFRLTLTDDSDVIEGETVVTFRVVKGGVSTFTLDLVQPKAATPDRGMVVSAVTEVARAQAFDHRDDRLAIRLDPAGRAGETRRVAVSYRGIPATGLLIAPNNDATVVLMEAEISQAERK